MTVPNSILDELGGDERAAVENLQSQLNEIKAILATASTVDNSQVTVALFDMVLAMVTRMASLSAPEQLALLAHMKTVATDAVITPTDGT